MSNPGPESHGKRMERCALQSALVTLGGAVSVMRQKLRTETEEFGKDGWSSSHTHFPLLSWAWSLWFSAIFMTIQTEDCSTQTPWKLNNVLWMNSGQRAVNESVLRQFLGAFRKRKLTSFLCLFYCLCLKMDCRHDGWSLSGKVTWLMKGL